VQELAVELAEALPDACVDVICGPLVEGAFVAMIVALHLDVQFVYAERFSRPLEDGLFPVGYRIPDSLRKELEGKRVAIVNDVIHAGSAVRGTFADLEQCGAMVVSISALLVLGSAAAAFAASKGVPLRSIASLAKDIWTVEECPLCALGVPCEDVAGFSKTLSGDAFRHREQERDAD
jgi:orotate phosphoribosyltransferase